MKRIAHIIISVAIALTPCFVRAQQYDIIRQGVCWTDTSGIDSSLTRMVYVSIAGAGPISVRYVNASGDEVDVSAGGSFAMGYCGCCVQEDTTLFTPGSIIFAGANGEESEANYRLYFDSVNTTVMIGANDNAVNTRSLYVKKHLAGSAWAQYAYMCNDTINCNNSSVIMYTTRPEEPYRGGNEWSFTGYGKTSAINFVAATYTPLATDSGSGTAAMSFSARNMSTSSPYKITQKPAFIFYNGVDGFTPPYNMALVVGAGRRTGSSESNITGGNDIELPYYTTSRNDYATDPSVSHIYYPDQYGHMLLTIFGNGQVQNPVTGTTTTINSALASAARNVANANLTADASYTTDWQNHSITFDFSGAPLDSMVYRFPSPDGKLQGLYVSDGEGNMSFIVNKIQSTDFDNMLDHNNAGIITLGNINDSTIIQGDMIFIESPNMPQNDTLQNAYTKGAGNKVSITKIPYSGITTATTDGSGDITVTLGITMPDNTYAVTATPQGSTFQVCNVVSKTATSFVLRFYTAVGVPITSTEVTANWIVRDN